MVELLNAVVIHAAVMSPRWLIKVAGVVISDRDLLAVDKDFLGPWLPTRQPFVVWFLARYDARITA